MNIRWRACILTAILCLLASSVLAADGQVIPPRHEGEAVRTIQQMVTVGDTVYFTLRTDGGGEIRCWREGMGEAETVATGVTFASSYTDIAQAYEALGAARAEDETLLPDVEHAITRIFSDGETLYAFNNLNGRVFTLTFREGRAVCTDVVTLQDTSCMYRVNGESHIYRDPVAVCAAGDAMLWLDWTWPEGDHRYADQERVCILTVFSLRDGSSRAAPVEGVWNIMPYRDGKVLTLTPVWNIEYDYRPEKYLLHTYDPATDAVFERGAITTLRSERSITYSKGLDTVFYQSDAAILGKTDFGMPVTWAAAGDRSYRLAAVGTSILMENGDVNARTLQREFVPEAEVHFSGMLSRTVEDSFAAKYPKAVLQPFYPGKNGDLLTDERLDAISLGTASGSYQAARDAGQLADLSESSAIRAYVESLYPPFRRLAEKDGGIFGIPVKVTSNTGFYINRKVQKELGLQTEAIPTSLTELCAFVTDWNENDAKKYPTRSLLENVSETYRARIFDMMYAGWVGYCQTSGTGLHFDDPVFREMLAALDAMDASLLEETMQHTDLEDSDYMEGLIWDGCTLVGNFASYMESFSDRTFIPMTLTPETPFAACVSDVEWWCIPECSDGKEHALALLEEVLANMNVKQRAAMQSTWTEAVRNPGYEQLIADTEKDIASLREMTVANGNMAYREIDGAIRVSREFLNEQVKRQEYRITPSALQNYREIVAPAVYVHDPSIMPQTRDMRNALFTLRRMYGHDRLIDMETFIRAADEAVSLDAAGADAADKARYALYAELGRLDSSSEYPEAAEKLKEMLK